MATLIANFSTEKQIVKPGKEISRFENRYTQEFVFELVDKTTESIVTLIRFRAFSHPISRKDISVFLGGHWITKQTEQEINKVLSDYCLELQCKL